MSLDFHKPLTAKKMKKRKELDALVSSEKLSTKYASAAANGGVSGSVNHRVNGGGASGGAVGRKISRGSHQLLEESGTNSENENQQGEMSGDGEVYAQLAERRFRRRQRVAACGACGQNCVSFLGVCSFLLAVACIAGLAALAWMQMELKRELSLLREQIRHAGEKDHNVDGDIIKLDNTVKALSAKEVADANALTSLQTAVTDNQKGLEKVKSTLAALQKSVASATELDNLPHELQALKKEVATVGSNVATLRDETKKTAATVGELKTKVEEMEKKLAAEVVEAAVVKEMNATVAGMKEAVSRLTRTVYGEHKSGGVTDQLDALKSRVDDVLRSVEEIEKARDGEVKSEGSTAPSINAPTTQPTPAKQNIISAQPHDVTGVVGETTTSSSPASEVASTSILQRSNHEEELSHIESLLAANQSKKQSAD